MNSEKNSKTNLHAYQRDGIAWLIDTPRAILADDMGLGKTVQAIGLIDYLFESIPYPRVAIVCPASLTHNWRSEWKTWGYDPNYPFSIVGYGRERNGIIAASYEQAKELKGNRYDLLIIDEAHYAKDKSGNRFRICCQLADASDRVVLLTGTPMPNGRPIEVWALLAILNYQGLRKKFRVFAEAYCDPKPVSWWVTKMVDGKKKKIKETRWNYNGAANLEKLGARLRETVMLRRLKADVLSELPPKRRQWIQLAGDENGQGDGLAESFPNSWDEAEEWLKQPGVYGPRARFDEVAERRHADALEKVPEAIKLLKETLGEPENARKVLIFAHHKDVLEELFMGLFEYHPMMIHGNVPEAERHALVSKFRTDESIKVAILGLTAAGVGITLTESSWVVFVESSWVPGVNVQAEDRAHRIGQKDSVLIWYLVKAGTLDAKVTKVVLNKQAALEQISLPRDSITRSI